MHDGAVIAVGDDGLKTRLGVIRVFAAELFQPLGGGQLGGIFRHGGGFQPADEAGDRHAVGLMRPKRMGNLHLVFHRFAGGDGVGALQSLG